MISRVCISITCRLAIYQQFKACCSTGGAQIATQVASAERSQIFAPRVQKFKCSVPRSHRTQIKDDQRCTAGWSRREDAQHMLSICSGYLRSTWPSFLRTVHGPAERILTCLDFKVGGAKALLDLSSVCKRATRDVHKIEAECP